MMMFILILAIKYFLDKLGPKNENKLFKVKLYSKTTSNMLNSMVVSILYFRLKISFLGYHFSEKLVLKVKISD